jgi:diadenosine tetraphosphate (Ap4A) HIT family hydrolase
MPVVFRYKGFRFFFYSNEGNPREPAHIHVIGQGGEAKFWVTPTVSLATSDGFNARTLRELEEAVVANAKLIQETWNEYFRT